jgi:hypothetical protein
MGSTGKNSLISSFIVALFILFLMNSCGAVKKNKSYNKEEVKVESTEKVFENSKEDSNIKSTKEVVVDDKNQTITETEVLEPIDATKPAIHTDSSGKKTELNNAKKTTTKTTQKNNTVTKQKSNLDSIVKKEVAKKAEVKKKDESKKVDEEIHVKRSGISTWQIVSVIVIIALIIIAWYKRLNILTWLKNKL